MKEALGHLNEVEAEVKVLRTKNLEMKAQLDKHEAIIEDKGDGRG